MNFDGVDISLGTIFGIAVMAFISVEVVKRLIRAFWFKGKKEPKWYGVATYASSLLFGTIWSVVWVLAADNYIMPDLVLAVARGFIGGFIAIAGFNGWKQIKELRGTPQE